MASSTNGGQEVFFIDFFSSPIYDTKKRLEGAAAFIVTVRESGSNPAS